MKNLPTERRSKAKRTLHPRGATRELLGALREWGNILEKLSSRNIAPPQSGVEKMKRLSTKQQPMVEQTF